jgi:AcrR family transcriptional regulator
MKWSENITNIAAALVQLQSEIEGVTKTASNSHFKSKYADLASVLSSIREPLARNNLCIIQGPHKVDGGVEVETMVLHKSGEWLSDSCYIPINKWDAHGMGSAITYGRRYGLMSVFCIPTEDDDGNAAAEKGPSKPVTDVVYKEGLKAANVSSKALTAWWSALSEEEREQVSTEQRIDLKARAKAVEKSDV